MVKQQQQQQQAVQQPTQPAQQTVATPKTVEEASKMSSADLVKAFGTKANAIRGLDALGMKISDIAKTLGIIYQHARNTLKRPLKREIKAEREMVKNVGSTAASSASTAVARGMQTAKK